MGQCILEMKNISKAYDGHKVLKDVNLTLNSGEIHCLLGENGAGKSTLMNILFGMRLIHQSGGFQGELYFEGNKMHVKSPKDAMNWGIGMVHQEFMLIPGFTIMENIKLNRETLKHNIVSRVFGEELKTLDIKAMREDARQALETVNLNVEEWLQVAGLPVGHMQFIEIAREIDKSNIKVLIFDEPTAVLAESEAKNLLATMKKLAQKGIAILFITHRLEEVMSIADKVSILRDGELVCHKAAKDISIDEIAETMVGRKITIQNRAVVDRKDKEVILDIQDFHVMMPGEEVHGMNMQVYRGEILGIGGLAGQGKIGIANGIMGLYPASGHIIYNSKELSYLHTRQVLKHGFAFVSEDRKGVGLILDDTIDMNIAFTSLHINKQFLIKIGPFKFQNTWAIRRHTTKMIKELDIRCTSTAQHVGRLSGGNQQKVCLARALTQNPNILLVSEPTRGIDIGAKKRVLDLLLALNRKHGMTIIMTSSELAELRSICHRIAIISEGKLAGMVKPTAKDKVFGLLMSGKTMEQIQGQEVEA
ncbi:sugar ABC transporter ATP-binding protein [Vallitalea pronyensis]|uniref:Sugar ABC transporter ATP-binding protein n=1 Tax=Vallitalea pronyensis TaxID=1348613 RepID=A0A8J8MNS4_9FIRM|nr:sugar ABC transporter ATP-binding protein [Vallitalea pronyensis]QUI24831.1 sugar ABC transporter ATP-binding protein [Vallitalea pronyensis]